MSNSTFDATDQSPVIGEHKIWSEMTEIEKFRLANSMTTEEINAINPAIVSDYRVAKIDSVEYALAELGAKEINRRFILLDEQDEPLEITIDYCESQLMYLTMDFGLETEESYGFYNYHRRRLWIEAYTFLLGELKY